MEKTYRPGAAGALLDEYEKAVAELKQVIADISDKDLAIIVDNKTADDNCKSIQTILSHVVNSAYGYAIYIQGLYGHYLARPEKVFHATVNGYMIDLGDAFKYTLTVFENIKEEEIEEHDLSKKITTRWGQIYDIEQLMEHAIVHILRHRRQVEKFKIVLSKL